MVKKSVSMHILGAVLFLLLYITYLFYPSINLYYKVLIEIIGIIICSTCNVLIFKVIKMSKQKPKYLRIYWILLFLALATFIIGDIIGCVEEVFNQSEDIIIKTTYIWSFFTNILFFLASVSLLKQSNIIKKGIKPNSILDIVLIYALYAFLIFTSISPIKDLLFIFPNYSTYFVICIIVDFLSLLNLSIIYTNNSKDLLSDKILFTTLLAMLFYTFGDLLYIYTLLNGDFVSNTFIDFFRIISISLIGLATAYFLYLERHNLKCIYTFKSRQVVSYIMIIGIVVLLRIDISEYYKSIIDVFICIIIIRQIKTLNENRLLINEYKSINNKLEIEVSERTKKLAKKNKELRYLSNKDTLTSLNNRRYLFYKLDKIIQASQKTNSKFGLLLIDLLKFKNINDLYGHEIGDLLLVEIAERFMKYDNKKNIIGRQGGDEFIIVCRNINTEEELTSFAHKIINDFKKKIYVKGIPFTIDLSIGGVLYPDYGIDKLTLMQKADMAMYTSKLSAYSQFNLYKEEINTSAKIKMEELMKNALINNEFVLYYQPQFKIDTNEIVGVEALIRWLNKDLGFVSPADFIPLAEETGLILDIGDWVIESAFLQLKEWNELYDLNLEMGINISPVQLSSYGFLEKIVSILEKTKINPSLINLEITEESAINNIEENIQKLKKVRSLGIKVSIDDFGSGYSSFKYLKTFVIDTLKIDMSLIKGIDKTNEDYEIAKAIINLGKGLNLNIIAEGVESESQLSVLKSLRCNAVQGYYHEKPLKIEDLERKYFR